MGGNATGRSAELPEAMLLEIAGTGIRPQVIGSPAWLLSRWLLFVLGVHVQPDPRCLCRWASPILPLGPFLPEPSISRQPQKSQAEAVGLKVQMLEKTVTSRERMVTEAARSLQATAQAMLQEMEPLTQVGSHPLRQHREEVGAAPGVIWGLGLQGREGQRPEQFFLPLQCLPHKTPDSFS